MYNWNPVFNLVMKIKHDYLDKFGSFDTYHFETWVNKLNKQEYNNVFECLQINQDGDLILVRYGLAEMQRGFWEDPNSIHRECRSVVIDVVNDALVLTPFRKFFNLNEVEENMLDVVSDKIKMAKLVEVSDKLDGSMQNARWYQNKVFMTGSMALNPKESWRLEEGYTMLSENYVNMVRENERYTFTFEYISLKDAHVVIYEKSQEGLYLIGIRNSLTGEQLPYSQVLEFAKRYNVLVVAMETKTLDELLEGMKKYKSHEKEGWILNIDGHFIKLKCDDYVNIHRILDKVSSVNVVIQAIADESYDDMISKIPEKYRDRIQKLADLIFDYVQKTNHQINELFKTAPKEDRKEFMLWVDVNAPKEIRTYLRNKYLGRSYSLLKSGHDKCPSYKRLSDMGIDDNYSALFSNEEVTN